MKANSIPGPGISSIFRVDPDDLEILHLGNGGIHLPDYIIITQKTTI
jgi:hypothetical protein